MSYNPTLESRFGRRHTLWFAAVATLAIAWANSAAWAQRGSQVIMRGNADGTHEVIQLTAPDYQLLRTPDFTALDLPLIKRTLVLSDEQVNVVRQMIEHYLEQFRALTQQLAQSAKEPTAEYNPDADGTQRDAAAAGEPDEPLQMSLEGLGVQLPPNVNINFGTSINRSRSDDPNTPPPPPEVTVSATIDAPEGEEIPDDLIKKIQDRANEVAARLREHIMAEEEARRTGAEHAPAPFIADRNFDELIAEHEALMAKIKDFERERTELRAKFVTDVQAVMAEKQIERWPALERALYRERSLPKGELPGESIDLVNVVNDLQFTDAVMQSMTADLEAYEVALDAALRPRDTFIATAPQKIDKAIAERKPDTALALADRSAALRTAVRGVNQQYIAHFAARLAPEHGERFRLAALKLCYPTIYVATRGRRMFDQIRTMEGIDEPTRRNILELERAYETELATLNEHIRTTMDRESPLTARRGLEHLKSSMDGAIGGEQRKDPLRPLFVKRGMLDDRYQKQVAQLLGEERAAALPKSRKERDPIRIESARIDGESGD